MGRTADSFGAVELHRAVDDFVDDSRDEGLCQERRVSASFSAPRRARRESRKRRTREERNARAD